LRAALEFVVWSLRPSFENFRMSGISSGQRGLRDVGHHDLVVLDVDLDRVTF
jgi:hypothetical protein